MPEYGQDNVLTGFIKMLVDAKKNNNEENIAGDYVVARDIERLRKRYRRNLGR